MKERRREDAEKLGEGRAAQQKTSDEQCKSVGENLPHQLWHTFGAPTGAVRYTGSGSSAVAAGRSSKQAKVNVTRNLNMFGTNRNCASAVRVG